MNNNNIWSKAKRSDDKFVATAWLVDDDGKPVLERTGAPCDSPEQARYDAALNVVLAKRALRL